MDTINVRTLNVQPALSVVCRRRTLSTCSQHGHCQRTDSQRTASTDTVNVQPARTLSTYRHSTYSQYGYSTYSQYGYSTYSQHGHCQLTASTDTVNIQPARTLSTYSQHGHCQRGAAMGEWLRVCLVSTIRFNSLSTGCGLKNTVL